MVALEPTSMLMVSATAPKFLPVISIEPPDVFRIDVDNIFGDEHVTHALTGVR
jgi:hypothetical protein